MKKGRNLRAPKTLPQVGLVSQTLASVFGFD